MALKNLFIECCKGEKCAFKQLRFLNGTEQGIKHIFLKNDGWNAFTALLVPLLEMRTRRQEIPIPSTTTSPGPLRIEIGRGKILVCLQSASSLISEFVPTAFLENQISWPYPAGVFAFFKDSANFHSSKNPIRTKRCVDFRNLKKGRLPGVRPSSFLKISIKLIAHRRAKNQIWNQTVDSENNRFLGTMPTFHTRPNYAEKPATLKKKRLRQ